MSKQNLERLIKDWSMDKVFNHKLRSKAFIKGGTFKIEDESGTASFLRPKTSEDIRIHAGLYEFAFQWRTCKEKGNRIIIVDYASEVKVIRAALEDYFLDPNNISDEEYMMFETLFPRIAAGLKKIAFFLDEAEIKLKEEYGNNEFV